MYHLYGEGRAKLLYVTNKSLFFGISLQAFNELLCENNDTMEHVRRISLL
jgi:hypothetical protein